MNTGQPFALTALVRPAEGAVGINFVPDASKKAGRRMVGDVDFGGVQHVAGHLTPVPGGVGPMTVAMLMVNTVDACRKRRFEC